MDLNEKNSPNSPNRKIKSVSGPKALNLNYNFLKLEEEVVPFSPHFFFSFRLFFFFFSICVHMEQERKPPPPPPDIDSNPPFIEREGSVDWLIHRKKDGSSDGSEERYVSCSLYGEDFEYTLDWPYRPFSLWMLFGYYAKNVDQAPNGVVWALSLASWNAVLVAIVSVILEILQAAHAMPSIQFRGGSLTLTLLSALLAIHTFADLVDNELDTTVQAMRVSLVVGVGSLLTDLEYVLNPGNDPEWLRVALKVPFMALNALGIILILFSIIRLNIAREVFGTPYLFSCVPSCRRVRRRMRREERERKFEEKIIREERRSREEERKNREPQDDPITVTDMGSIFHIDFSRVMGGGEEEEIQV